MSSFESEKLNQSNLVLLFKDALEQLASFFSIERLKWYGKLLKFIFFGYLGFQHFPHEFGMFFKRLFFPIIAVFLYFNITGDGLINLLATLAALVIAIFWLFGWFNELYETCVAEYSHHKFQPITGLALSALVLVFYQALYVHYPEIPYSQEAIDFILKLYSYLPTF